MGQEKDGILTASRSVFTSMGLYFTDRPLKQKNVWVFYVLTDAFLTLITFNNMKEL